MSGKLPLAALNIKTQDPKNFLRLLLVKIERTP